MNANTDRISSFVMRPGAYRRPAARRRHAPPLFGIAYTAAPVDFDACSAARHRRSLEIGFGMGETTAQIAAEHPQYDYLGIEVHTPGVGGLLRLIEAQGLTNIRVIQHDAVEVVTHMIAAASLSGIHVFFPDPWPKKRHHKRRLLQPAFVHLLASRLQSGGYLHVATDWEEYASHILQVLSEETLSGQQRRGFCVASGLPATDQVRKPRPEARPRGARHRIPRSRLEPSRPMAGWLRSGIA